MSACSQNLEESPLSDNKMDISDATNSQESAGVSPVVEKYVTIASNEGMLARTTKSSSITSNLNHPKADTIFKRNDSLNLQCNVSDRQRRVYKSEDDESNVASNDEEVATRLKNIQQSLDNMDNNTLEVVGSLGQQLHMQKNTSNLTLVNSHPLMSPTATDSDSENSCRQKGQKQQNVFSFPDVVPTNDQQLQKAEITPKKRLTSSANYKKSVSLVTTKNALNCNIHLNLISNSKSKNSILRASSPDVASSESETEISQYHASVEANYQSVALIANTYNGVHSRHKVQPLGRKNYQTTRGDQAVSDDMSSLDSISNHSFDDDDDIEHNLASLSPSSSLIDVLDDDEDDDDDDIDRDDEFPDIETPTNLKPADTLPIYSEEDERRDSRNWQKITLPDGHTREIDMKVIEPYKRVLSHGGYLKSGGHNAIVIFCACHLPDRSRADYHYVMDNLFLYVVKTLEQLVTEDYVLIYLHGGSNRRNVPPFPWLKKCYQLLDRRLRKSLKNLYLVHPTFWIKSIVWMARPFVSSKFWRKLVYVRSLKELSTLVSVEKAAIPDKVKQYDTKCT